MDRRLSQLRDHLSRRPPAESVKDVLFRWMDQKLTVLRQDIFIIGPPGRTKLQEVMDYLVKRQFAYEYVCLSSDVGESDLLLMKQLRDQTVYYQQQPVIKAALEGKILILDGIERAERNTLPALNNILENREMSLEDGTVLIRWDRYQSLLESGKTEKEIEKDLKFLCCRPEFCVIALGVPVPQFPGYPLDPPLRSRFQCFAIPSTTVTAAPLMGENLGAAVKLLADFSNRRSIPYFPIDKLGSLLERLPILSKYPKTLLEYVYPFDYLMPAIETVIDETTKQYGLADANDSDSLVLDRSKLDSIPVIFHRTASRCLLLLDEGIDFMLIGRCGSGKSTLIRKLLTSTNRKYRLVPLHREQSSRDLLQRRSTLANGDTVWTDGELVKAALKGEIVILDGLFFLPDGSTIGRKRISGTVNRRFISDGFMIIAIGSVEDEQHKWLTAEIVSLLPFVYMPRGNIVQLASQLLNVNQSVPWMSALINLMEPVADKSIRHNIGHLINARSIERLLLSISSGRDPRREIERLLLFPFIPSPVRSMLMQIFNDVDFPVLLSKPSPGFAKSIMDDDWWHIGNRSFKRHRPPQNLRPLIPQVEFYENPIQMQVLTEVAHDLLHLQQAVLLIGNQGVGKNKIVDYMLQCLRRPRHYVQLHRDSTVQSLTLRTTLVDGQVKFEPSALVESIQQGTVLVIDEADKAPTEVTAVLKSLVTDGEMMLPDGRRVKHPKLCLPNSDQAEDTLWIHPDFRLVVLSNRPGYPFLGNDFYKSLGYCFFTHIVDNPDLESEIILLRQYGPTVPQQVLHLLANVFAELRQNVNAGHLLYPYSTRELVNIVRHLERFPSDGISKTLRNVFDFDSFDESLRNELITLFDRYGIPLLLGAESTTTQFLVRLAASIPLPPPQLHERWSIDDGDFTEQPFEKYPLIVQGSWKIRAGPQTYQLLSDGMRSEFSEITRQLSVPSSIRSTIISSFNCGSRLVSVCTQPSALLEWDLSGRGSVKYIDIDEYLPGVTRLQAGAVEFNGKPSVAIINLDLLSIYLFVLGENSAFSLAPPEGFRPNADDIACIFHGSIIVLSQVSRLSIIDLNERNQRSVLLPFFPIDKVHVVGENILQIGSLEGKMFTLDYSSSTVRFCPIARVLCNANDHLPQLSFVSSYTDQPSHILTGPLPWVETTHYFELCQAFTELWRHRRSNWMRLSPNNPRPLFHQHSTSEVANVLVSAFAVDFQTTDPANKMTCVMEVIDMNERTFKQFPLLVAKPRSLTTPFLSLVSFDVQYCLAIDSKGSVFQIQVSSAGLEDRFALWRLMAGEANITFANQVVENMGFEEEDGFGGGGGDNDDSEETGSRIVTKFYGPRKLSRIDLSKLSLRTNVLPVLTTPEALRVRDIALKKRLEELQMTVAEAQDYEERRVRIEGHVRDIRGTLLQAEARNRERTWISRQLSGELDDKRLVESLTGQQAIYRRRVEVEPVGASLIARPKVIWFCFDLSASMFRFQSLDQRLERAMDVALMICDAFRPFQFKFRIQLSGHSGDSHDIPLSSEAQIPSEGNQTWLLMQKMYQHAAHCVSGDNTLKAVEHAVHNITRRPDEADEYFVVILSDANLTQYSLDADKLSKALRADPRVHASIIFIGSLDQAERMIRKLPPGNCYTCMEPGDLPRIMKNLLISVNQ